MSRQIKLAVFAVPAVVLVAACSTSSTTSTVVRAPQPKTVAQSTSAAPATTASPAASAVRPTAAAASAALSGTWAGQYSGAYNGSFTLIWTQAGGKLTGTIKISAPPSTMNINGTVEGDAISFGTVGSYGITYSGKVSGGSMSGSYQVSDGRGSTGPWSASKS